MNWSNVLQRFKKYSKDRDKFRYLCKHYYEIVSHTNHPIKYKIEGTKSHSNFGWYSSATHSVYTPSSYKKASNVRRQKERAKQKLILHNELQNYTRYG